jgi:beta-galactosidase
LTESSDAFTVTGSDFSVKVGKKTGALESFRSQGRELITAPMVPNFWRAPTDNDVGNQMPRRLAVWKDAGPGRSIDSVQGNRRLPQVAVVKAEGKLKAKDSPFQVTYRVFGNGDVLVEMDVTCADGLGELPRVGMQFGTNAIQDTVTWFGRGPQENYWDRKTGAAVGLYSMKVESFIHDYVRPEENANRSDVVWFALTDKDGTGLMAVRASDNFCASAWPYTLEDLEKGKHVSDLPRRDTLTVNIDLQQMGVGGDDSWGAPVHKEYKLPPRKYGCSFILRPLGPNDKDLSEVATRPATVR